MTDAPHPYAQLPAAAFWKTAVADREGDAYAGLWQPRHAIGRHTRFATAGSCFAQHISRWLQRHGYTWVDSEPAPGDMDDAARVAAGHGVFSFRTGNIYSAALLRQWVFWALGLAEPPATVWCEGDRWVDPYRPAIPAAGFDSADAVLQARTHTLQAMRRSLAETDVLVFTLGLTEAWVDADGSVYPMCPGTVRGRFDAGRHHFVNYDAVQVQQHLDEAFDALRRFNPALRFLLTVSPVPLTATASGRHVLVATMQSKSVLRAAAAALQARRDDVDYFPSYELIAGSPSRGRWFDDNLRTVRAEGVAHVMSHFAQGLGEVVAADAGPVVSTVRTSRPLPPGAGDETVCEDVLLSSWAQRRDVDPQQALRLCVMGDSHMGKLSQALGRAGVAHWGGMIMKGSSWHNGRFARCDDEILVPLEGPVSRRRWTETLRFFGADNPVPMAQRLLVTNLTQHSHVAVPAYVQWAQQRHGRVQVELNEALAFFRQANKKLLLVLKDLLARGLPVLVLTDPPTQALQPSNRTVLPVFEAYELVAQHVLLEMGCQVLDTRAHFRRLGWHDGYHSTHVYPTGMRDWIHGSAACYDEVAQALVAWWQGAATPSAQAPVQPAAA